MSNDEFVKELRSLMGDRFAAFTNPEMLEYIKYMKRSQDEQIKRMLDPNMRDRGIEALFQSFGTPETVLAAFLIQLFAKYSTEIVGEFLKFLQEKQESDDEKEVSGSD